MHIVDKNMTMATSLGDLSATCRTDCCKSDGIVSDRTSDLRGDQLSLTASRNDNENENRLTDKYIPDPSHAFSFSISTRSLLLSDNAKLINKLITNLR